MTIKEKILNDMPDDLNEIEKARYIYLKLASVVNFSTKLNNTDDDEYAKMYTVKIDTLEYDKNQVICKYWAKIYSQLLDAVGITNQVINQGHEFVRFVGDGYLWIADATFGNYTDLARVRYGDETEYFGLALMQDYNKENNFIHPNSKEIVASLDEKFDFYQDQRKELDRIYEKMEENKKNNQNMNDKAKTFFGDLGKLRDGYYESKDYVRNLEYKLFTEEEMKNIHAVELKRTNPDKEVDIIQCIYIQNEDHFDYYLLAPNKEIKKVDSKDIIKLSVLGYGKEDKEIPGIIYPRDFNPGVIDNKVMFYKLKVPPHLLKYDEEQMGRIK